MSDTAFPKPALAKAMESEHPFCAGELLDRRFRILREIAQGGMGIVYEAWDEKLERRIALKCAKLRYRGQLPREARSATEVSHPNVCKIFEIHTAATAYGEMDFITMEFLEGETLSDCLRRRSLSEREALSVADQLCAGLYEAHRIGLIHGDLKTNNVILTRRSKPDELRAVITDFGLAHRPDALPGTVLSGAGGGTRGYMSPELLRGERASVASDIYALGVIFAQLASNCFSHAKTRSTVTVETMTLTAASEVAMEAEAAPVLLSGRPKWDRVVRRCLQADPGNRYASVEHVRRALDAGFRRRRRFLAAAGIVALGMVSAEIAYERATAPATKVKLSIARLQTTGSGALREPAVEELADSIGAIIGRIRGGAETSFASVPNGKNATHALQISITQAGYSVDAAPSNTTRFNVTAHVVDLRTGIDLRTWTADYTQAELRYLPGALTGVVTRSFGLPANATPPVRSEAKKDLDAGLGAVRKASGADRALPFLLRAVAEDPDSPLTHAALAEAQWFKYASTRDRAWLAEAARSVRNAERRQPDLAPVLRVSGLLKYDEGQYELARSDYQRAIHLDPADGDAYRRLGMAFQAERQLQEAQAAYYRAIAVAPQDYRNQQQLGAFEDSQANYEKAVEHFRQAVQLAPDEPEPRRVLGDAYQSLGKFQNAEEELRRSLQIAETSRGFHSLGVSLMFQGRDREAIPYLEHALATGTPQHLWVTNLSIAYRRCGRIADFHAAVRRAIALADGELRQNPRDPHIRSVLAYLCARSGDRDRARSEVEQALRPTPVDATTQFYAAATYEALGRREETLRVLASAPPRVLEQLNRWPDVAELGRDSRFIQLLGPTRH